MGGEKKGQSDNAGLEKKKKYFRQATSLQT